MTSTPTGASVPSTLRPPFDYDPIVDRDPVVWPGGARVAFYVGLNIEHFRLDLPATSMVKSTAGLVPDPLNYGWRDYGVRVGLWRVIDALEAYGIAASALINSEVVEHYPQIVAAGRERGWAWLAHGATNSRLHSDLGPDEERAMLTGIVQTIEHATGQQPYGWLGRHSLRRCRRPHCWPNSDCATPSTGPTTTARTGCGTFRCSASRTAWN